MKDYNKVESCLKSFLKNNKRLSYSMALLITFLINGGFSYADEAVQVPLRTEIKTRIEKEQENISQMLKEADESMKDIELKIKKLTQRGEFWVKPLEKSYQGFIFANWGNYSKNKNKTESNFNGPEYSASYGRNMGYGQFSNGKYYGEYGIVKNPLEFVDKIDFGANITPKAVIEKTIVEKTVIKKDITAPSVTPPTVEVGEITLTAPEEVAIGEMTPPNEPTVNVQIPGTIPTLSPISVTPVTALNINPTPPTVGDAPTVTAPTVTPPATPAGFTPRLVSPPTVAEKTVNISPVPNPPSTDVAYQAVPANVTGYRNPGDKINGGLMSQLELTAGTFNIYDMVGTSGFKYSFTGATATNGNSPSSGYASLPSNDTGTLNGEAFYRHGGKALTTIGSAVTINAVGKNNGAPLNSIFYLGNNTTNPNSESKLINKATVNLYGNKIAVSNIDNVSSAGDITFVNEGNIIGHAVSEFGGYQGNSNVGNYIFGGYSYGNAGVDKIENGASGKVIFYAPNSVGWAYTSGATQTVKEVQ